MAGYLDKDGAGIIAEKINELNKKTEGKYTLPSTGIPKTDLASAVQESLGKADTALQSHQPLTDYAKKTELPRPVYYKLNGTPVTDTGGIGAIYPIAISNLTPTTPTPIVGDTVVFYTSEATYIGSVTQAQTSAVMVEVKVGMAGVSYAWNDITGKPDWLGETKPSYTKSEVGLGNVLNVDTTDATNITKGTLAKERLSDDVIESLSKADTALQKAPDVTVSQSGSGNVVTDVKQNGHGITVTKGETFAKQSDFTSLNGRVGTVEGKIPTQASATNQLADKSFVNSSVQTATANFRGNWDTWADIPSSTDLYPEDYAGSKTPTTNDYLVVKNASGYNSANTGTWRFKYSGAWGTNGKSGWKPEYQVNETPLTSAQLAALNSGVTSTLVGQITTNKNDIASIKTKNTEQDTAITNAQNTANGKYTKPTNGIPSSDLAKAVQDSLALANSALQSAPVSSVNGKTGAVTIDIPNVPDWALSTSKPSYDYSEIKSTPSIPSSVVQYTSQSLTTTQKSQARTNIGAGTSNFSGDYNDLSNKPTIPTIPSISITNSGNGNAVTSITSNGHTLTVSKGANYATTTQLNGVQSTAEDAADTAASAVETANSAASDASSAKATANSALTTANDAQTTADNAMPKSGGEFTGDITAPNVTVTKTTSTAGIKLTSNTYPVSGNNAAENHTTQVYNKVLHHHGDLNWINETTGKETLISQETLAYWNGRYSGSASNLQYFKSGEIASVAQVNAKYTKPSGGIPASDLAGSIPASKLTGVATVNAQGNVVNLGGYKGTTFDIKGNGLNIYVEWFYYDANSTNAYSTQKNYDAELFLIELFAKGFANGIYKQATGFATSKTVVAVCASGTLSNTSAMTLVYKTADNKQINVTQSQITAVIRHDHI